MAKILFICSGNVGRSQMAEAFYNHFTNSKNAFSAGIDPNTPTKYPKIPNEICQIMKEENIAVSNQKVKLIKRHFVDEAEKIFVMCKKDLCPDFLTNSEKVVYWKIEDPYEMNIDDMRGIRDQIKIKVKSII
ncbi:MAG: low molecular weight phosphatase family protein [Candidatus Woesearchaeota archaeon]